MRKKKIYAAMVTPFDEQFQIDEKAVIRLCHHLISMRVDGIVVCGTTGEVSSLTFDERAQLLHLVKKTVGNKAEIWMGCGTNNTQTTLQNCIQAEKIGVDGIMLITPYYVRPSQKGLFEHFSFIASQIRTPLMLYNVPKRTGVNLEAKTVIELSKCFDHIVMLKQAHDDPQAILQILSESSIKVMYGDDFSYIDALQLGVDGIVSVAAQVDCRLLHRIHDGFALGIMSHSLVQKWKQLSRMCFLVSSPADVKCMLSMMGICKDVVRLPLVQLDLEERLRLQRFMEDEL